ncbi:MAG: glycosyltransferase [Candidatus Sumerlaeia bacterium]|nr:glycosyltransferase [Candidatus Sumerlaeia bacterium]
MMKPGPRKLRMAHIITAMTVGGAQRMLIDLLRVMPPWVEPRVYTLYRGEMAEELRESGIPVEEFNYKGVRSLLAIPRWVGRFRDFRPHIVHTHLGKADLTGRTAAYLADTPIIMTTCHNTDDWKDKPHLNFLDNISLKPATAVICISKGVTDFLVDHGYDRSRTRLSFVRSDLAGRFGPEVLADSSRHDIRRELSIPDDTLVTIMVGRFYPQKAHDVALRSLARMEKGGLGKHVLLLAGDGPLRPEMERLAADILTPGSYRFLGNRKDVPALLAASDVYLMPSRWEGFGLALAEACAAGLPSVVSDVVGMKELADSCGASLYVPPEDEAALAEEWSKLLADGEMRRRLGEEGRRNAIEKWDVRIMAREYLGIYADLCRASKKMDKADLPPEFLDFPTNPSTK